MAVKTALAEHDPVKITHDSWCVMCEHWSCEIPQWMKDRDKVSPAATLQIEVPFAPIMIGDFRLKVAMCSICGTVFITKPT